MKKFLLTALALGVLTGALTSAASAYTVYMKPASFYAAGTYVSVEAAYATQFFTPAVGINSPGFAVIGPNGHASGFDNMAIDGTRAALSAAVAGRGTYRITTGETVGAISNLIEDGAGGWRLLAAGETPAEGAQTTTLQTVTLAESYVTQGAPNRTVVDMNMGRLGIHPVTHPNQVLVSTGFQMQLLLDGQPLPGVAVVLYGAGDPESKLDVFQTTDAQGNATFTFDHPGTYMIAARFRGPAPADAGVAVRSYTTTLTFDVMTALPPAPPPEPGERRHRSLRN